jgi:hypothetical protein
MVEVGGCAEGNVERESGRSTKASLGGTDDEGDSVFTVVWIRYDCAGGCSGSRLRERSCSGSGFSIDMIFDLLGGSFGAAEGGVELGAMGGISDCWINDGAAECRTGDKGCLSSCPCIGFGCGPVRSTIIFLLRWVVWAINGVPYGL